MGTRELVKQLKTVEKSVSEYGEQRLSLIARYSSTQLDFIEKIEETVDRGKKLLNADPVVRRKHAMSQQKILKKMAHFFKEIDTAYKKGDIQDKEGKVFARAYEKAIHGHFDKAREILLELEDMTQVYAEFVELEEEAKNQKKKLVRKQAAIQSSLEEAAHAKPVDDDYVKKHEEVLRYLEKVNELRAEYIQKLRGKTVTEYVSMLKNKDLVKTGFPNTDPTNITNFLSLYPELSEATPETLLEYDSWTDGKLKHTIPETKKFRSMMQEYGSWLEQIKHLESTKFIVIMSVEDAKKLSPLFKETEMGDVLSDLNGLEDYWRAPPKDKPVSDTTELKKELSDVGKELALLKGV